MSVVGIVTWIGKAIAAYFISKGLSSLSREKQKKEKSPTYSFSGWKPSSTSSQPVPIILGINKVTGNWIWRTPTATTTIKGALGIGEGEILSIEDVRIDGKAILELPDCSISTYLGTIAQIKDDRFEDDQPYNPIPIDDTHVYKDSADPHGAKEYLRFRLKSNGASYVLYAKGFLQFDLSQLPADTVIISATLKTYIKSISGDINGIYASYLDVYGGEPDSAWSEENLVWGDDALWVEEYIARYNLSAVKNGLLQYNVTDWVTSHLADEKVSFVLLPGSNYAVGYGLDLDCTLYTKEKGSKMSILEIVYQSAIKGASFKKTAYVALTLNTSDQLTTLSDNSFSAIVNGLLIKNWDVINSLWQTSFNNNPAWEVLFLLTNSSKSLGLSEDLIDLDSFKEVAVYCDAEILNSDSKYEKRFFSDIVIDTKMSVENALRDILGGIAGFYYYIDGKINLGVEKTWTDPKLSFDKDSIIEGSFSFGKKDKNDIPNQVKILFTDGSKDFVENYAIADDELDQEIRGVISQEIVLYSINRASQASRMAKFYLNKNILCPYWCYFQVGIRGMSLCPGDVIEITHALPGWTSKEFRIINLEETDEDEFEIFCEEYNASIYNDEGLPYTPSKSSILPNPEGIPPIVTALNATETFATQEDGTYIPQIQVDFTKPDYPYSLKYQIWWKPDGGVYQLAATTEDNFYKINVAGGGILYYVMILTQSVRSGVTSTITGAPIDSITIVGKDTAPTDVTFIDANCNFDDNVYLEWNKIDDSDLAFYEVRTDANWGNQANMICQVKGTNYTWTDPSGVTFTFYIKARDNSGNYSTNADTQVLTNTVPSMPALTVDFTMRDCIVSWAAVTDKDFRYYKVVVYNQAGYGAFDIVRTEEIQNTQYTYTFEMNDADNVGALRTIYFRVTAYDKLGQSDYSDGNGTNSVPATPAQPTVTAQYGKLKIDWTTIAHPDVLYYNVYCDTNADPVTIVAKISGNSYTFTGAVGTLYYVKISAVDSFGEGAKSAVNSGTPISIALTDYNLDLPLHNAVFSFVGAPEFVEWTSATLVYKGVTYSIAAGNTSNLTHLYIWWDKNSAPTTFHSAATRPAIGSDIWLMAYFDGVTTIYPATQNKIQHAGLLQASTITADLIGANEIIANAANIKDAIITSAKIISLAVEKLTVGLGGNMVPNSIFENDFAYWTYDADFSLNSTWKMFGKQCAYLNLSSADGTLKTAYVPVDRTQVGYCASFYYYLTNLDDLLYFRLEQYDKDKVIGTTTTMKSSGFTEDAWTRFEYNITSFDADCAYLRIFIFCDIDGALTTCWFDGFQIEPISLATQVASPWKEGGLTNIDGNTITTGLIQSVDTKTYFDLINSVIAMVDGNNKVYLDALGLRGYFNAHKMFDLGVSTGRGFFKGGILNGRLSSIPLYAFSHDLDITETQGGYHTFGGVSGTGGQCVYYNGYVYFTVSQDLSIQQECYLGRINCVDNTVSFLELNSDPGNTFGVCFDGTYLWVTAMIDTNLDEVYDEFKIYKVTPSTFTSSVNYDIDAPAGTPFLGHCCYDNNGQILICDLTNSNLIVFTISTGLDAVIATTDTTADVCIDGTYAWVVSTDGDDLYRITAVGGVTTYNLTGGDSPTGVCFDGKDILVVCSGSGEIKKYNISGTLLNTSAVVANGVYSLAFDGKYIWIGSGGASGIVKMRGDDLTELEEIATTMFGTFICFDGLNLWSTNSNANGIEKIVN
ncbi:MAG: phage tail protein [Bacteroidota bacterium]